LICFAIADKNTEIDQYEINEMRNASKHGVDAGLTGKRDLLDTESKWKQQGSQIAEKTEKRNRVSHISVAEKEIWRQNSLTLTYIETSPEAGIATAKAPVSTDTKTKETKQRARFAEPFLSL
jgi:hypothetical protein